MTELRRLIGPTTALLIGMGVAIGSGIFRTPGLVAEKLGSPFWIVVIWVFGGAFVFLQGLVSAELATRYPKAGGEYVYLREAYGEFLGFFFGWSYTVFIIGGGAATIAAAAGEALAGLLGLSANSAPYLAAGCVITVASINALGLKTGAIWQNLLTVAKISALLLVVGLAFVFGGESAPVSHEPPSVGSIDLLTFVAAFPPVLWAYEGATDTVKMAEEVTDPARAIPRAVLGSAVLLTVLYTLVNVAYLHVLSVPAMAQSKFVANDLLEVLIGEQGRRVMSAISVLVFLGSLSSTILATVRVTFALGRDGLSFRFASGMSEAQAPIGALLIVALFATTFCLFRGFGQILNIYFLASAVLFGLAYLSLIVFRVRDRREGGGFPEGVFRCPAGPLIAAFLIGFQLLMAWNIIEESPMDSLYTLALLAVVALLYGALKWRRGLSSSR